MDQENTLALTTVTFDPDTGEIYDADMEINSTMALTAWDPNNPDAPIPADGYDFLSIVTHETGHFLGMAHSVDMQATMYAHYTQGETVMRLLTADDIDGICNIYPANGTRNASPMAVPPDGVVQEGSCDPTPRHGWTSECCAKLEIGPDGKPTGQCAPPKACSVAGGAGAGGDARFAVALAALAAVLVARRRRP
jgi:MYXO-CTERM domain-containing protein